MSRCWQLPILLGLVALVTTGADYQRGKTDTAKIMVVFVDVSGSIQDFDGYRGAWAKILGRLQSGDRLVLGRITDETYTRFRPVLDQPLPTFNPFTDNKLRYEKQLKAIRQEVTQALETTLTASRSAKTDVLNSLTLAAQIFQGDARQHRVLVLLSDMLEDSDEYRFEQVKITDAFIKQVIDSRQKRGRIPDLGGATVYVAGASARTAAKVQEVQQFWVAYMQAAHARLLPHNYGPALVNFNE